MDYESGRSTVVDWLSDGLWIVLALGLVALLLSQIMKSCHALSLPFPQRLIRAGHSDIDCCGSSTILFA